MKNQLSKTLAGERVDTLAALVMVSHEQLEDRKRAEAGIAADENRLNELISLVFGSNEPTVENYLAAHGRDLVAA